jgi:GNAT superfamily N-acetyltransferase
LEPSSPTSSVAVKSETSEIAVRAAETDHDVAAIHYMLVYSMAKGAARAPVDPDLSMQHIWRTVSAPAGAVALMAFKDGNLVGTMGIEETRYWYSRETFMRETWLYVLPEHENGGVMKAILAEARAIAELAGKSLFIAPTAKGRKRGARKEHVATIYEFTPAGELYAFHPGEN